MIGTLVVVTLIALVTIIMATHKTWVTVNPDLVNTPMGADSESGADWGVVYAVNTPQRTQNAPLGDVRGTVLGMVREAGISTQIADFIIKCESSWRPNVWNYNTNKTYDVGLWQINDHWGYSWEDRRDPIKSTKLAIEIIQRQGFRPWVCYKKLSTQ